MHTCPLEKFHKGKVCVWRDGGGRLLRARKEREGVKARKASLRSEGCTQGKKEGWEAFQAKETEWTKNRYLEGEILWAEPRGMR